MMTASTSALEPFVDQKTVLLTTYKRDGTGVGTPVHIAVDGDRAFARTWDTTWKLKRIRNNPEVEVGPCTASGRPTGPAIRARARVLGGDEAAHAAQMLARKYPILHGFLIPRLHRLRGNRTMHIELTPLAGYTGGADPVNGSWQAPVPVVSGKPPRSARRRPSFSG